MEITTFDEVSTISIENWNKIKKRKKCKACKEKFTPLRALQSVCGYDCSIAYAKVLADKKEALNALNALLQYRLHCKCTFRSSNLKCGAARDTAIT